VPDVAAALDRLLAAGARPREAVSAVGGGKLVASVTDADGNVIGLVQAP
jgi:predicted enzyme related to lactoylglutathione lyase